MYQQSFVKVKLKPEVASESESESRLINICVYEQKGSAQYSDEPIVLVHATGFHAHCWDEVCRQLPERRIFLIDLPCHGQSDNLTPPLTWRIFADCLVSVLKQLDIKNIRGVGHSMGGHLIVRAAAALPDQFASIIALDPVIMSLDMPKMSDLLPKDFEHPVAKRRNNWPSSVAMLASYKKKAPFNEWNQQVLEDYCEHALLKESIRAENVRGEGSEEIYPLACPPELEGEIYLSSDQEAVHEAIKNVECPVTIFRARSRTKEDSPFDFGPSTTYEGLAAQFKQGKEKHLPDNSHFIPMEIPHEVAAWIESDAI